MNQLSSVSKLVRLRNATLTSRKRELIACLWGIYPVAGFRSEKKIAEKLDSHPSSSVSNRFFFCFVSLSQLRLGAFVRSFPTVNRQRCRHAEDNSSKSRETERAQNFGGWAGAKRKADNNSLACLLACSLHVTIMLLLPVSSKHGTSGSPPEETDGQRDRQSKSQPMRQPIRQPSVRQVFPSDLTVDRFDFHFLSDTLAACAISLGKHS